MCGVFGYIGKQSAVDAAIEGLQLLEYRGYDSSGVAALTKQGELLYCKSVGKVAMLKKRSAPLADHHPRSAIAHTRWATHGKPNWENAHPQLDAQGQLAVMHNGIVENHDLLRRELQSQGFAFLSETDTEVIAHLIARHYRGDMIQALRTVCCRLKGSYSFLLLHKDHPGHLFAVASGSPLVLGLGSDENFIASDLNAFIHHTKKAIFLHAREIASLSSENCQFWDFEGRYIEKQAESIDGTCGHGGKGPFAHFMLKEIFEQPQVARSALHQRCRQEHATAHFDELEAKGLDRNRLAHIERILLIGCGTSWHAGSIAAQWIEELARLPAQAEIASEFRSKNPVIQSETLVVAISQSGETADTLAAVRELRAKGVYIIGLCNAPYSSLAREVDATIALRAGPEISVCSTKAFTCQLMALSLFSLMMGRIHDLSRERGASILDALEKIPEQIAKLLEKSDEIRHLAKLYSKDEQMFYIGRRYLHPTALEGALKLKEISYINATGYPSGELKHGPIALISPHCATVALAADEMTFDKTISNILEIKARGGRVLALSAWHSEQLESVADDVFIHEKTLDLLSPILSSVFGQLFAYFIALDRAREIDCPRNLAKSVTVE